MIWDKLELILSYFSEDFNFKSGRVVVISTLPKTRLNYCQDFVVLLIFPTRPKMPLKIFG